MPVLAQSVRHAAARRAGHGRDATDRSRLARDRQAARVSEGARAAAGLARRLGQAAGAEAGARHGAEGGRSARRARRSCGRATTSISRALPIQTCWPGDAAPLITWGLMVTRGPHKKRAEPRHLPPAGHRPRTRSSCAGSRIAAARSTFAITALAHPREPFPVAVALGADPATMLGAVTPVPDTLSRIPVRRTAARREDRDREVHRRTTCRCRPRAEIVLEGHDPSRRDRARRAVRRSHRLLQRAGALSGVHHRAHHAAARSDLSHAPIPASRPTSRRCSAWR